MNVFFDSVDEGSVDSSAESAKLQPEAVRTDRAGLLTGERKQGMQGVI